MNETTTKTAAEWTPEPRIYRIIRFYENGRPRTIRNHCTLTEAQNHCCDPKTQGIDRNGNRWFDGYDYMRGCRPDNE